MEEKHTPQTGATAAALTRDALLNRLPPHPGDSIERAPIWALILALIVVPVTLLALYYFIRFSGLREGDALDFAQLGRNLVKGRGFVTYILRPLALEHGGDPFRQPEVTHGPLFPLVLALAFGALGARDSVAAAVSGGFYLLTVPLLYLLGRRLFDVRVGLASALLFGVNSLVLDYAISGMHLTMVVFLTTLLLLLLRPLFETRPIDALHPHQPAPPFPTRSLVLAGVLTAALYLTEPACLWFIPCFAGIIMLARPEERLRRVLTFLGVVALVALPWMARNGLLTGNPLFGLRGAEFWMAGEQPITIAYRFAPDGLRTGLGLLPAIGKKAALALDQILAAFPTLTGIWLIGVVLPSLLFPPAPASARIRGVTISCFLLLVVGSVFARVDMPLFVALIPTLIVFGVSYLQHLAAHSPLPPSAVRRLSIALGLVAFYPLAAMLIVAPRPIPIAESIPSARLQALPDTQALISDQPWLPAWYGDRPAIWIPADDAHLAKVRRQFPDARWLFLTPQVRAFSNRWAALYDVFQAWNVRDHEARAAGKASPAPVGIRVGDPDPLFGSLGGLAATRLEQPTSQTAVLGVLPAPKGSK